VVFNSSLHGVFSAHGFGGIILTLFRKLNDGLLLLSIPSLEEAMRRFTLKFIALTALFAVLFSAADLRAQMTPADTILFNGKIITVDQRFSVAQAVAIRGERIVAVGTSQEISKLAGSNTKKIDL